MHTDDQATSAASCQSGKSSGHKVWGQSAYVGRDDALALSSESESYLLGSSGSGCPFTEGGALLSLAVQTLVTASHSAGLTPS